ncbi:glutamine synthetase family protein [Mesorhizobium sp. B4-1-4]|uniref:glutamine synthetase family protein n=1 Tax=Mesorhizobium sp. B4-1-4 TaxID=2589888 RepID=UPI001128EE1D|nr:glutamine synthetase family protein [Mesorhizobium sp. B4-1-4]UCI31864.1 glutamine synthetase family protein [Mesorhizobium sp. B4-1-4]
MQKTSNGEDVSLVGLVWVDLCGIARVRGVPVKYLGSKADYGLSFPSCGQAMTMFGDIIDNPWGGVGDVRQIPVMSTLVRPGDEGFGLVLSEAMGSDGKPWDLCARTLLRGIVNKYENELGVKVHATFEQEFKLLGDKEPALSMTVEAWQQIAPLDAVIVRRLEAAGIQIEAFEPEFVPSQYELSVAPKDAVRAADEAVIIRETVRDAARRAGYHATFAPKTSIDKGGSGLHIHISFTDQNGRPILYDANGKSRLSSLGQGFVSGVLRHGRALLPFVAPGVASYYRLGPKKWSTGYVAYGTSNREAMLRICSLPTDDQERKAKSFNIEFRAADGLCNPYLALAAILIAGMQGIQNKLPLPPAMDADPSKLSQPELDALQLVPVPSSLEEALKDLDADDALKAALPRILVDMVMALRRREISQFKDLDPDAICTQYAKIY